ncbi:MAG: ATP-dependent helicase HrpB [Acidobacteria bacterium]|nr:MAG: ATP-dependent helicase HrpB [Acidobacteriota bacterium]
MATRGRAERPVLPIDELLGDVVAALEDPGAVVVRAATGAGKTSRVPPAVDAAGLAAGKRIVMLEPRRIAARAAARRMAAENGWRLGAEVGYRIRLERRESPATRILVVTEGVLLRMLQADPLLADAGVVIFDEFHERRLDSDLALAMVRRVRREVRPDLKLVVMSATLEAAPIARYLGDCPAIASEGRGHPVTVAYLEAPDPGPLESRVARGVRRALDEAGGDVLAFLPGVAEIRRTGELLAPLAAERDIAVMPLYGDLPAAEQDAVLRRGRRRKVVLATNVAETSITIDGVGAVVDGGLARVLRFDPAIGLDRLQLARISRASAEQRAGRAGRQGPGFCLRLWTEHDDRSLEPREQPEIRRLDLAGAVLQLLAWGETDAASIGWLEPPPDDAVARARALLRQLGAVGAAGVTRLGQRMARLPLHPRLARLLIAGHEAGELRRSALLAALLGERDVIYRPARGRPRAAPATSPSDALDRLEAIEAAARGSAGDAALGPVHRGRARHVLRLGAQLERLARRLLGPPPAAAGDSDEALLRSLLAAFPDRVARRRRPNDRRAVMAGGRGVRLAPTSAVREAPLFVCIEVDAGRGGARGEALVRLASAVERDWLEGVDSRDEVVFDPLRRRVVGMRRTRYRDLLLEEVECPPADAAAAEALLVAAARRDLASALPLERPEVQGFLARLRCLAAWLPEEHLPVFDDDDLARLLPALAAGKRSFAELRQVPLLEVLRGSLEPHQLALLEREAPERLAVPSGSRIRLRYEEGQPPILAARIQELFGLRHTPRLARGRIPVLLHLLAPNQRPQQVTQDLESFWANTYPQVRKELAGRYPKHAWPEDPLTAHPERHPRRRRR